MAKRRLRQWLQFGVLDLLVLTTIVAVGVALWRSGQITAYHDPLVEGTKPGQHWAGNGLRMKFRWCPSGRFTLGSPKDEKDRGGNENQVSVTISRGFWLGKHELTQSQWERVMDSQPWSGKDVKEGDDYPATYISWEEATKFCEELTRKERAAGRLPADWEYRLPTEAQWEYACRAGGTKRFHFGDDESDLGAYAWFDKNASFVGEKYPHEVGGKRANDWGLHDMHGNVWEWCRDWYKESLPGGTDPDVTEKASDRVLRGGSWFSYGRRCRSAYRNRTTPGNRHFNVGFRVALVQSR